MQRRMSLLEKIITYAILIVFAIIILYPIAFIVTGSFKSNSEIYIDPAKFLPSQPTLDNYRLLFSNENFDFGKMLTNSIMYSVWSIACSLLVTTMGAYVFSRGNFPGKKIIFTAFTALMFITPGSIAIYCKFDIIRFAGLSPNIYTLMLTKLFAVPIVGYYQVRGYIDTLPKELDESARIDGCSFIGILFRIIFPLLKPVLAMLAIFAFQGSWNNYTEVLMWTSSRPENWTLTVGVMSMKNSGNAAIGTGFTMAAAVISIIPVIIVYCCFNKLIVDGIAAGAVKG
ncbi:MAG: carbohydrate ABC transporter permease [Clostridia bacterium]|nr:carbohydrate ABC transporter permease [Clostridia bacterium]